MNDKEILRQEDVSFTIDWASRSEKNIYIGKNEDRKGYRLDDIPIEA